MQIQTKLPGKKQAPAIEPAAREWEPVDSAPSEEVSVWPRWSLFSSQRCPGRCCVMVVSIGKSSAGGHSASLGICWFMMAQGASPSRGPVGAMDPLPALPGKAGRRLPVLPANSSPLARRGMREDKLGGRTARQQFLGSLYPGVGERERERERGGGRGGERERGEGETERERERQRQREREGGRIHSLLLQGQCPAQELLHSHLWRSLNPCPGPQGGECCCLLC